MMSITELKAEDDRIYSGLEEAQRELEDLQAHISHLREERFRVRTELHQHGVHDYVPMLR